MEDKEMLYPSLSRTYRLPFQAAEGVNDNDTKVAQNLFKDTNCCTNESLGGRGEEGEEEGRRFLLCFWTEGGVLGEFEGGFPSPRKGFLMVL